MRKLILLVLTFIPLSIFTQNTAQDFEKGIKMYHGFQAYIVGLDDAPKITSDVLNCITEQVKNGIAFLDQGGDPKTEAQIKAAQYFKVNFLYKQACIYAIKSDKEMCFQAMHTLKDDFETYNDPSKFPIRYCLEGKDYEIQYRDFVPVLTQFYTVMSELGASMNDPHMQYEYACKAYNFPVMDAWYKYIALTQMVDYLTNSNQFDIQTAQYALEQMRIFNTELNFEEQKVAIDNNYPTPLSSAATIKSVLDNTENVDVYGYISGETAIILMTSQETDDVLIGDFFETAVRCNSHIKEALEFAKSKRSEKNINRLNDAAYTAFHKRNEQLGIDILDKLSADNMDLNLEDLKTYADDYALFGEIVKAKLYLDKYYNCLEIHKKRKRPTGFLTKTR